jgi:hypothetical protein
VPAGYPDPLPLGGRYGRLIICAYAGVDDHGHRLVSCKCDCGQTRVALAGNLRTGATSSCGCIRRALARDMMLAKHRAGRMPVIQPTEGTLVCSKH